VHGGGAFLLLDLLFIFLLGIPVLCAEFIIGRHTGLNIRGAFRVLAPGRKWAWIGYMSVISAVGILSFYSVVAGWTLEYLFQSFFGFSDSLGAVSESELHSRFDQFATSDARPVAWTLLFLMVNFMVLVRGVQKGIEKVSNILLPALFLLLLVFCVNSLLMPGAGEGLRFLFKPDFSKVTPSVVIGAMGQAFFSLSLGLGCMVTYASYFHRRVPLLRTAFTTVVLDTLVAVIAGMIIFPAVFTFGKEPAAGPQLIFEVLPSIFSELTGGMFWSAAFFLILFIASLTSTISMAEIAIAFLTQETRMDRRKATALTIGVAMVFGALCALSFGSLSGIRIFGMTLFNVFDYTTSNLLLPIGGLAVSLFVGWFLPRKIVDNELIPDRFRSTESFRAIINLIIFCLRYVAPICIGTVFIAGLL
ncbi:MAG: sodium-dependent transporter, partial [Duncaniella sp.]|nr:sodium-dependent transporter [Duncaniella sp.]